MPQPTPSTKVPDAALPRETGEEVQFESIAGIWRVTGVLASESAGFKTDDPRIVGALMDAFPEQLRWSYTPGRDFAPRDLCLGPVSGLIANAEIAADVRAALAPALLRSGRDASSLSRPHQWLCGDGGDWGDDAEFQLVGEDRMVMRWPGDLTLVLDRVRRLK